MNKLVLLLVLSVVSGCASIRSPYMMKVTDWSGNIRPYYIEGESLNLHVWWDSNLDTGKPIDCSFSNSFNGEIIWRGVLIIPETKPGQLVTNIAWNPVFPETGLKLDAGSYIAVCNFNNEAKASVGLNIMAVKPAEKHNNSL